MEMVSDCMRPDWMEMISDCISIKLTATWHHTFSSAQTELFWQDKDAKWRKFDKDGDGELDEDELKKIEQAFDKVLQTVVHLCLIWGLFGRMVTENWTVLSRKPLTKLWEDNLQLTILAL